MATKEEIKEQLDTCLADITTLQEELDQKKTQGDCSLLQGQTNDPLEKYNANPKVAKLKKRHELKCDAKVSDVSWYPKDNEHLTIVLQDGKIITHNVKLSGKSMVYYLSQNTWLMSAEYSPSGSLLAVAGLDNNVTLHTIPDFTGDAEFDPVPSGQKVKQLSKHGGYIGSCKFLDESTVVSSSGDKTIMLWDITQPQGVLKEPVASFIGHGADVGCVAIKTGDSNLVVSASSDTYCKLWDKRVDSTEKTNGCVQTFAGHTAPVNKVRFLGDTDAFVSASEDGSAKLWDLRCESQVMNYAPVDDGEDVRQCTAVNFSKSGAFLFVGYENGTFKRFDTISGTVLDEQTFHAGGELSTLELSTDGTCMASGARQLTNNFALWA